MTEEGRCEGTEVREEIGFCVGEQRGKQLTKEHGRFDAHQVDHLRFLGSDFSNGRPMSLFLHITIKLRGFIFHIFKHLNFHYAP